MDVPLAALADLAHLSPADLGQALLAADETLLEAPALEVLADLMQRLPAGLVHAEGIWLMPEPPEGLVSLAESSPWYAIERSIAVVVPLGRAPLLALLRDLGQYALVAERVRERLAGQDLILAGLASETLEPALATELALILDDRPARAAALDEQAPGLRAELLRMIEQPFEATVWIHADLRPSRSAALGVQLAESLRSATFGPAHLVISETPLLIEHLSPYVRDLGHALYAWAKENPARLRTPDLLEALGTGSPDDDLAALVAAELLADPGELLEERREAEASQGLVLADRQGTIFGHADLARLVAPDPAVSNQDPVRIVWVVAGGAPETLLEAARALLETRRVASLLFVGEARYDGRAPLIPEALSTDDDAVRLETAGALVERAKRIGIDIELAPDLEARPQQGAHPLASAVLGLHRRAQLKQLVSAETLAHACFFPRPVSALAQGLGALQAARLGLAALTAGESQKKTATKTPANTGVSGFVRRFRA